jgi:hypothetical protein
MIERIEEQILPLDECLLLQKNNFNQPYFWLWLKIPAKNGTSRWTVGFEISEDFFATFEYVYYFHHKIIEQKQKEGYRTGVFLQNNFGKNCIEEIIPAYWNKQYFE